MSSQVIKQDKTNIKYLLIALVGIVIPWVAGFYLAKSFGFDFGASIFVGTALTATSIAITANVLKEMDKLQTEAAKAIIGAAIIDDVLSLLALTIAEETVSGVLSLPLVLVTIAKAIGFLVIGVFRGSGFFRFPE